MLKVILCIAVAFVAMAARSSTGLAGTPNCTTATPIDCVDALTSPEPVDADANRTRLFVSSPARRLEADAHAKTQLAAAEKDAGDVKVGEADNNRKDKSDKLDRAKGDLEAARKALQTATDPEREAAKAQVALKDKAATEAQHEFDVADARYKAAVQRDALRDLLPKLHKAIDDDHDARRKAFDDNACEKPLILCLDRDGLVLLEEEAPPILQVGDKLTVLVFSNYAADQDVFTVTITGVASTDRVVGNPPAPAGVDGVRVSTSTAVYELRRKATSSEVAADTDHVHMDFRRKGPKGEPDIKVTADLAVARGTFHLEINVSAAFVPLGARTVRPSGRVETDLNVGPAFGFTWYFWSRTDRKFDYLSSRSAFGLSVATDFNFTISPQEKDWYAGLVWSPMQGFGIAGGIAFVHGQFRASSLDTTDVVDDMAHAERKFMTRPYVAIVLTPELIGSLISASSRTRSLFAADQSAPPAKPPEPPK